MGINSVAFEKLPDSIADLVKFLIASSNTQRIVLFGSRARGDFRTNSDFDFALWVKDRDEFSKLLAQVEEANLTLLPFDLVVYSELSPEYQRNIDREGVVIYAEP